LTKDQVERFIAKLKDGLVWSNGLVGHDTLRFDGGCFLSEFQDLREPEYGPYVHSYSEEEFRAYLLSHLFPDFVHRSLVRRLDE